MGNLKPERALSLLRARLRKISDDGAGGALRSWTRLLPLLVLSALALWFVVSGVGSQPAAAAVTNRGFETGDLTGWTQGTVVESVPSAAGTRTLEWGPGWHNAVWTGGDSTPEEAFACAEGKYAAAYRYTTSGWQGYFPGLPDSSTMTGLAQYDAFLILITESVTCAMPLEPAPGASRTLEWAAGWQNAGWTGADGTAPEEAFACAEGKYAAAYRYTTGGWEGYFPGLPDSSSMTDLAQYDAFLILVTAPLTCDMSTGGAPAPGPTPTPGVTPTPSPTPTATPSPIVFTGQGDKDTSSFHVPGSSFTIGWTTQSDSPEYAGFSIYVYPEGEDLLYVCEADFDGVGSDSTVCHAGPGDFWIAVLTANLSSWRIEIGGPPPLSDIPVTFTGQADKDTSSFHVSGLSFTIAWNTQSDSPEYAGFSIYVYPEGETALYACSADFDGIGSDSTVCHAGPGDFWIAVLTANLSSWRVDVSG